MNVLMVRAKIKEENVADARAAIEKVIQALEQAQPAGVRYASCLLSDGVTFSPSWSLRTMGATPCAGSPPTRRWWKTSSSGTRSRRRSSR